MTASITSRPGESSEQERHLDARHHHRAGALRGLPRQPVVGVALPPIRADLGGTIESLEWTVNAYTAFAVLLITGAALGDRFDRRRMFAIGVGLFTAASAASALAPTLDAECGTGTLRVPGRRSSCRSP